MRIKRKFLQLTRKTYPFQTEKQLINYLPEGYQKDIHGNYFLIIGKDPKTMFTCHLDTACSKQENIQHRYDGKYIKTDGRTILGADDKAGMTIILYMIENKVPGLYYFFIGEEVGCIGSTEASKKWEFKNYNKCISFDRRGTYSIITHQFCGRCCSDEFAEALSKQFNDSGNNLFYQPDNTGVLTDSAQFTSLIPECTNISVGYYKEHTREESQDLEHLVRLCKAVVKVDWESLPIKRSTYSNFDDEEDNIFNELYNRESRTNPYKSKKDPVYLFIEEEQDFVECYLSDSRIRREIEIISNYLITKHEYFDVTGITWTGNYCYIWYGKEKQFLASRPSLASICPDLNDVKESDCDAIVLKH